MVKNVVFSQRGKISPTSLKKTALVSTTKKMQIWNILREWPQIINIKSQKISNPHCKPFLKYYRGVYRGDLPPQDRVKREEKSLSNHHNSKSEIHAKHLLWNKSVNFSLSISWDRSPMFNKIFSIICITSWAMSFCGLTLSNNFLSQYLSFASVFETN